jgi:ABC-2 type transport system permease protein
MLKLCWKDFIASRWFWLLILIICALYGTFPILPNSAVMVLGLGLVVGLLLVTLFVEDRYRTEALYCSLPLKRSTIVQARYLLSGLVLAAGTILMFAYGYFVNSVLKMNLRKMNLEALRTLEGMLGFLFTGVVLVSFFFPLFFRFGLAKGTVVFTVILIGFIISMGALFSGKEFLIDPGAGILRTLGRIKHYLTPPLFLLLTLALAAGIIFLSVRLSTRFYDQRDF